MGEDRRGESLVPVHIVVDDSAMSEAAVRYAARYAVRGILGSGAFLFCVSGGTVVLGVLEILSHAPFNIGWAYLGIGVMQMLIARFGKQMWRRPIIPTEFVISDEGLTVSVRGEASARAYPWKRVRTAMNSNGFFIVIVGATDLAPFQRAIAVPKPEDAALSDAIWTALYAHMIAPRGLRATPADRLGVIRNTAFA